MLHLDYKSLFNRKSLIIGLISLLAITCLSVFLFFFFKKKREDENVEYIYSYDSVGNREDNDD